MTTTPIIASFVALAAGVAIGVSINNTKNTSEPQPMSAKESNTVAAEDYLAMQPAIATLPTEELTTEETNGLLLMREEEKLARDVYQTLYEQYGMRIFSNIAQSEQTHTEAVRSLLVKYDLNDPVTDDAVGVFANETLQQLYDDLVAQGSENPTSALIVGATVEDLDIKDLQELSTATDNKDIALVYTNLERGSRNHLRSFMRQLTAQGGTYEPQYISAEYFKEIVEGSQETGNGHGTQSSEKGNGRGMGNGQGGGGNRGWGGGYNR